MCWYCFWGLPKPVADIFHAAENRLGRKEPLLYGPSHIVWADNNLDDDSIEFCIKACDERADNWDYEPDAIAIVRESLAALLLVPEEIRCPDGCECEDDDIEQYPPPAGMVMVQKYR